MASRYLSRYENEKGTIDLAGIARLAKVLRVPMAYLVADDDIMADTVVILAKLSYEDRRHLARRLKLEAATFVGEAVEGEAATGGDQREHT